MMQKHKFQFNSLKFSIMDFNQYFENFTTIYDEVISNIIDLREQAQEIKEHMDSIIDSCETLEGEL